MTRILKTISLSILLIFAFWLGGCEDKAKPLATFAGGGFIFNYRIGEAYYGVVIATKPKLEVGSAIQATFDNPSGDAPITVVETARPGQRKYMLRTPGLKGVKRGVPYKVVVKIIDPRGHELTRLEHSYKSEVDQSTIPAVPLVIGPGFTPNPEYDITKP